MVHESVCVCMCVCRSALARAHECVVHRKIIVSQKERVTLISHPIPELLYLHFEILGKEHSTI